MRALFTGVSFALLIGSAAAADIEVEFTEQTLNRLVGELGNPGAGGLYQPAGALSSLGLTGCRPMGAFQCANGSGGQSSTTTGPIAISLCTGPDGLPTVAPSADPVPWQWWITDAHFSITPQQLTFTATLRYRIGRTMFKDTRTVPAALSVDLPNQQLHLNVSAFNAPIRYNANGTFETLANVDVGRFMSFTIPMSQQTVGAHDFLGNQKSMSGRVGNAEVQYLSGKIVVAVDGNVF